jgi:hypothetical protein
MTKAQIAMAVLIVGVVAALLWSPVVDPLLHRARYRGEVLTLYENLQPGLTKQEVEQVMDSGRYPHLQFHRGHEERWSGATPSEFGAGNWVLVIEFQGGQVSALRVRTADGDHDHPAEAPPDKVRPSHGSGY